MVGWPPWGATMGTKSYRIMHKGHIAAFAEIACGEQYWTAIFVSHGKPAEISPRGSMKVVNDEIPLKVRAAVNRDFGMIFATDDMAQRGRLKNSLEDYVIHVSDTELTPAEV